MINFLKYKVVYLIISSVVILTGFFFIVRHGFLFSIDFTGGTNLKYKIDKNIDEESIKKNLKDLKIKHSSLSVKNKEIFIKSIPINEKQELLVRKKIEKNNKVKIDLLLFESVGPAVGKDTINKTVIAALLGILAILGYISFAFKGFNFALSAIIALIHDLLILVSVYSVVSYFFKAEIDTLFVTAVLTTMSFSVHDTIVIFDKIREYVKLEGRKNIEFNANKALTETMVRSLNNSMTIVFMLLSLILLGGSTIKFFIVALFIGTITGTYSSPFVATPILVWLEKKK
jgi:preprotein translocase subunit SecF